ncbi:hypothetical protein D3C86_1267510 [compost metagenome]
MIDINERDFCGGRGFGDRRRGVTVNGIDDDRVDAISDKILHLIELLRGIELGVFHQKLDIFIAPGLGPDAVEQDRQKRVVERRHRDCDAGLGKGRRREDAERRRHQ